MKLRILSIGFILFFLSACTTEKINNTEMEIHYFNEVKVNDKVGKDKLPELYEITKPLHLDKEVYVFMPLSIKREDIGKLVEIDYLTKKGRNYKKINAIERAHRELFKDGKDFELDKNLTIPVQNKLDFDAYVATYKSKPNYFFIDFNGNLKIDGEDVPNSSEQLQKKIEKYFQSLKRNKEEAENKEIDKIVIIVTPNYYQSQNSVSVQTDSTLNKTTPEDVKDIATVPVPKSKDNVAISPPPPPPGPSKPNQIVASSMEDFIAKVASSTIPDNQKQNMIDNYTQFFTPDAKIVIRDNNNQMVDFKGIKSYISLIRSTGKKVIPQYEENQMHAGKYQKLNVRHP